MSKMLRLELVGLLLLACTQILTEHRDFHDGYNQYGNHPRYQEWRDERITREIRVKHGRLRGMVVRPQTSHNLPLVDVFLGVPYAEPPVGSFRFSPPRSPQPWRGVRQSQEFAPVCPQVLPNLHEEVKPGRYEYLERLLPYLRNQSEDCLYLNIYAPHQADGHKNLRKYPVMVFIHGESYEWNSGNPYDGSTLAAYGNVVFVSMNFRLGILGFLRPGTKDDAASNFGLLDQIAALLWIRENIAEFGGNPNSVTLVGHGTGAIFANLLLISPVASNKGLFKRAILMSGSALSSDAIGKAPLQITKQVAHALNCPTSSDATLATCLRNRDIESLLNVKIHKPKYVPAFAPLIDTAVIPDKPLNLMENAQLFGRYDLMYGVTESEKFHILPPVALLHGMHDEQRDEILRDHAKATHELEPDLIVSKVLEHYGGYLDGFTNEYVKKNRDMVLEAISDSGTVAPLIMTANLHSRANPKSYMYVFAHPKAMQDYTGDEKPNTIFGEELPYILGMPLSNGKYYPWGNYEKVEILFSEAIMNWWCNFAHTGNPNAPRRFSYLTGGVKDWSKYEIDWPEYDPNNQTYLNLTIPPEIGSRYRFLDMQFWNKDVPDLFRYPNFEPPAHRKNFPPKGSRPEILNIADGISARGNDNVTMSLNAFNTRQTIDKIYGKSIERDKSNLAWSNNFSVTTMKYEREKASATTTIATGSEANNALKSTSAVSMVIGFGLIFLFVNVTAFLYFCYKRHKLVNNERISTERSSRKEEIPKRSKIEKRIDVQPEMGYKSASKPDLNDVIKTDKAYDNNSNFGRQSKHSRHNSNSTIDTHIKVREWIQQEIVHRCSPRFLRKTRESLQKEHQDKLTKQKQIEKERKNQLIKNDKSRNNKVEESIYEDSPTVIVRPGKKSKVPKVSVAIDATPATRTESVLNQIPIELSKVTEGTNQKLSAEYLDILSSDSGLVQYTPQVVVIEHHHSKSDPLPMESVLKSVKSNFSNSRIYESDSGSTCSLYAKVNPKLKSKLLRPALPQMLEGNLDDQNDPNVSGDGNNIYEKIVPNLVTFNGNQNISSGDVNVTSKEPVEESEHNISHEEALKTIKRRNYPKVLPDIQKRRSLPTKSSLTVLNKQDIHLKDQDGKISSRMAPSPPPRIFGAWKSLELDKKSKDKENLCTAITNLHVGPLLMRSDSMESKKNSNSNVSDERKDNFITSLIPNRSSSDDRNLAIAAANTETSVRLNPVCPIHGSPISLTRCVNKTSLSTDALNINTINRKQCKNLESNVSTSSDESKFPITSTNDVRRRHLDCYMRNSPMFDSVAKSNKTDNHLISQSANEISKNKLEESILQSQKNQQDLIGEQVRIVITPKIINNFDSVKNSDENRKIIPPKSNVEESIIPTTTSLNPTNISTSTFPRQVKTIISANNQKDLMTNQRTQQPKIIIKPTITTASLQRNRNNRNVPKVSAIPSPERQNFQNDEKDCNIYEKMNMVIEKDKSKFTRIPSFSKKRSNEFSATARNVAHPVYAEKSEIIQRINVIPRDDEIMEVLPFKNELKSSIPTIMKIEASSSTESSSSSTENSNSSNTGTIKKIPLCKQ